MAMQPHALMGRIGAQGIYPTNLFLEPETKDQRPFLRKTAGLYEYIDFGYDRPVRGMLKFNERVFYAICWDKVYKCELAAYSGVMKPPLHIGSINAGSGKVFMSKNSLGQIAIVSLNRLFIIEDDVIIEKTDLDFVPTSLTYQDTYFICSQKNSGRFYISNNNDGYTWNALDYSTAESHSDDLVVAYSNNRELWLFGSESTEVFYNSGASFPFVRIAGAIIETGTNAAGSVASIDGMLFWLTNRGEVVMCSQYSPSPISSIEIEREILGYSKTSDAIAFAYKDSGHIFYQITFPTANRTWCFDITPTGVLPHRRSSYYDGRPVLNRHRANCHLWFDNKNIVGDSDTGIIYVMDTNTYSDNGEPIVCEHTFPPITQNNIMIFHKRFMVDCFQGVGLMETGDGKNPKVSLQWSNDLYKTWSNIHPASLGTSGHYLARCFWTMLGSSRWRAYRISISAPVEVAIYSPLIDVEAGFS